MREILGLFGVIALIILIFAWSGNVEATAFVEDVWNVILKAVSTLGDAWRES